MSMEKSQILIIDDEITSRTVLERYLSRKYSVVAMEDGEEALNWLKEDNFPNLIIVDVEMPNINGYEFLKLVKENDLFKKIPVVMLSGIDNINEQNKYLELGAIDFIEKPFNPKELEIKVENSLK